MARIPIYDSAATENSAGAPNNQAFSVGNYIASVPFRLFGVDKSCDYVSYEFMVDGQAGNWLFYWYQEFWADRVIPASMPTGRADVGVNAGYPWPREQKIDVAAAGAVPNLTAYDATRAATFAVAVGSASVKWFSHQVFAPYARLQVSLQTQNALPALRLRIWAICAAYNGALFENMTLPYGWNYG